MIGLGMLRDPNGKISEQDEQLAVACAVQNMYLTCAAYGLGAFWATGAALIGDAMREHMGLGAERPFHGPVLHGLSGDRDTEGLPEALGPSGEMGRDESRASAS